MISMVFQVYFIVILVNLVFLSLKLAQNILKSCNLRRVMLYYYGGIIIEVIV